MKKRSLLGFPSMLLCRLLTAISYPRTLATNAEDQSLSSVGSLLRGSATRATTTTTTTTEGFVSHDDEFLRKLNEWNYYNNANKTVTHEMTKELRDAIELKNLMLHLEVWDDIANNQTDDANRNRAAGTVGYDLSRDYVFNQLEQVGYNVQLQEFSFLSWSTSKVPRLSSSIQISSLSNTTYYPFVQGAQDTPGFDVVEFSGSGDFQDVQIQGVDLQLPPGDYANNSTSGCEPEDFDTFEAGRIALIQRGTCSFSVKAQHAMDAGALGVIIFNEGQKGRTGTMSATLSSKLEKIEKFPVLFTSFDIGNDLAQAAAFNDTLTVSIFVESSFDEHVTTNVIADSITGDPNATIVVGAHLDSVTAGAGINDNGSGSTAILETAIQMAKLNIEPDNKIQFVWFGGEEFGLHGSAYFVYEYIAQLNQGTNNQTIALMLNLDMVANPNGVRIIALADNYPTGSSAAANIMMDYCDEEGLPYDEDPTYPVCLTDSCYFIISDIPVTAIGAGYPNQYKTQEEFEKYGGTVDEPIDACYHKKCDNITNINQQFLDENADIVAHTVMTLGLQYDLMTFLQDKNESVSRRNLEEEEPFEADILNVIPSIHTNDGVYTM